MLHLDLPSIQELRALSAVRADACVSIYLETTPITQHIGASRIALANLAKEALAQLQAAGLDKRRRAALGEQLDDLGGHEEFWRLQAVSLAVLATPDSIRAFRLPNTLKNGVHVADRFHLKPLLRATTFPHEAYVLALAENAVRVVHVLAAGPAETLRIRDLPNDASDAAGRADVNNRDHYGRIVGAEGQKVMLRRYAREVDAAVRAALKGRTAPLILAAAEPLASLYRLISTHPHLAPQTIAGSPVHSTDAQLADAARPILDALNRERIAAFHTLYAAREQQSRATGDVAVAARAATRGAIEALLIDMDETIPGFVDDETGAVTFAQTDDAAAYGVVDEIASRALASGAEVLSVRRGDIPGGGSLAAVLRYRLG